MPYMSRRKRRRRLSRKAQNISLLALVVLTVCAAGYAFLPKSAPHVTEPVASAKPAETAEAKPEVVDYGFASFKAAASDLRSPDKDYVLTVIGDSTGFPVQGWVEVAAKDIQQATGRRVILHTWDSEKKAYGDPRPYGEGERTLTIWNGSAPGETPGYSSLHLDTMMPEQSDLVVVNHGHNLGGAVFAGNGLYSLLEDISEASEVQPAVAVTLQNPEVGGKAANHEGSVSRTREVAALHKGVVRIDAYTAFMEAGGLEEFLMDDGVHPTDAGYRLWADVFLNRLGF